MGPLIRRAVVALIAIPFVLLLTFWDFTPPFKIAIAAAVGLSLLEYLRLVQKRNFKPLVPQGLLILGFVFLTWGFSLPVEAWGVLTAGLALLLFSFIGSRRPLKEMVVSVSVTWLGTAYFSLLGVYFFRLREMPGGSWHLFWLYLATWSYDTGAYFFGSRWGRHRMAPKVSPKKSWEGCAGGFLTTLACLFLLWNYFPLYAQCYRPIHVVVISALLSFFAQMGDLVGSVIKRSLAVKDSGSFFPGHGGMFDRIGSLLLNAPVLFYYLVFFKP
jgi:phosphatidate cytidylyltransferase